MSLGHHRRSSPVHIRSRKGTNDWDPTDRSPLLSCCVTVAVCPLFRKSVELIFDFHFLSSDAPSALPLSMRGLQILTTHTTQEENDDRPSLASHATHPILHQTASKLDTVASCLSTSSSTLSVRSQLNHNASPHPLFLVGGKKSSSHSENSFSLKIISL